MKNNFENKFLKDEDKLTYQTNFANGKLLGVEKKKKKRFEHTLCIGPTEDGI